MTPETYAAVGQIVTIMAACCLGGLVLIFAVVLALLAIDLWMMLR